MKELDFLVRRDDLKSTLWAEAQTHAEQTLETGQVLLRIDRVGLTTNNITYGVAGEALHYWDCFPAPVGWGRLPVWGYSDVVASRTPGLSEGERIWGYHPISRYLLVQPAQLSNSLFVDKSSHRSTLPPIYQNYERHARVDADLENLRILLRPVFGTGFLVDDWLHERELFGARQFVVASASSKTALATAYNFSRRAPRAYDVIGLTSVRNRAFCEHSGYYDRVLAYDEIASIDAAIPTVFVDVAGDVAIRRNVHQHFGVQLRHSMLLGLTHRTVSLAAPPEALPGPAPTLFFAGTHIDARLKTWGREGLYRRINEAQERFYDAAREWLQVVHARGRTAIESAYHEVRGGRLSPSQGVILSPSD